MYYDVIFIQNTYFIDLKIEDPTPLTPLTASPRPAVVEKQDDEFSGEEIDEAV